MSLTPPKLFYPVIVVGAGPTGLTLTNLLARYGIETLLIERNATTVQEPRAVSIDDESLRTMQAAGMVESVLATVVEGYGSVYLTSTRRPFLTVLPTDRPYGYARRNAFRQPRLEAQLREALRRFPHVTTLFGHTLQSFEQTADAVRLNVVGPSSEQLEISCAYLVGADGANSTVRSRLQLPLGGETFEQKWLIVDLEQSPAERRDTVVFCDPNRACIALPGPDQTRRFEFKLLRGETAESVLQPDLVASLLQHFGAARQSRIARKVVYNFHARIVPRWSEGRVFLAGDACHLSPPFAGQGMNSGIRDAHNLAWKLAAVLRQRLGAALLATYEIERKGHVAAMIRLALNMGRIMSPRNLLTAWAIQSAFSVMAYWPRARDFFSEMRFKPKPRFTAGFLIADTNDARRCGVGELLPQPHVTTSDAQSCLLDELLGDGFALVAVTESPTRLAACGKLPALSGLKPRLIAVSSSPSADGVRVVSDPSGRLAARARHRPDTVFLVRPDRYIAGAFPLAQAIQFDQRLQELLRGLQEPD